MSNQLIIETTRNVVDVESNNYTVTAEVQRLVVDVNSSTTLVVQPIGFNAENKNGTTLDAGCIVAKHSSGSGVVKADASTPRSTVGLATTDRADTEVGAVQTDGVFELADWTAITGTVSLAANATYFLSPTPGMLTTTAPSGNNEIQQVVGRAMSSTILDVSIMNTITIRN